MEAGPLAPRQRSIRDLANKDVSEGQGLRGGPTEEVAPDEVVNGSVDARVVEIRLEGREGAWIKRAAQNGAQLSNATGRRVEPVETRQDGGMNRVGDRGHGARDFIRVAGGDHARGQRANDLAGKERVLFRPLNDRVNKVVGRVTEQVGHELADSGIRQRIEVNRDGVASPAGPHRSAV